MLICLLYPKFYLELLFSDQPGPTCKPHDLGTAWRVRILDSPHVWADPEHAVPGGLAIDRAALTFVPTSVTVGQVDHDVRVKCGVNAL